jgi:hypothetical protein
MGTNMKSSIGKYRLAVGLSVILVLLLYFVTEPKAGVRLFLLPVLLPAVAGWAFLWVRRVFQRGRGKPQEGIAVLAAMIPAGRPRRDWLRALDFMHRDSYSLHTRTLGESLCCDVSHT